MPQCPKYTQIYHVHRSKLTIFFAILFFAPIMQNSHSLDTQAIHAGRGIDPSTGAVTQPIVLSTTFEREPDGSFASGYIYIRENNPNRQSLETCLAQLEGGAGAVCFSSGMASAMSILHSLSPGDHVVAPNEMYYAIKTLIKQFYGRWGLQSTFVDMTDLNAVQSAVQPNTKLLWTETPCNPTVKLTDLAAVSTIAHNAGALCVCDNTWAPLVQRPLELGCDLVMHSSTKYFGGHSDAMGGVVIAKQKDVFFEQIELFQHLGGAVPSPFDSWLILRSVSTLPHRMRVHCENAMKVASFLASHPKIARVHYPGLKDNPYHDLACKQMNGLGERSFGGMVSIELHADAGRGAQEAMDMAARLTLFTRATSLGGVESLVEHRASIEGVDSPTPQSLLRLSIGLESADDLIADLAQALGYH